MSDKQRPYELFTDGACSGNPGPGGWAYVLKDPNTGEILRGSGAESDSTNNRMELQSVIEGLRRLPAGSHVRVTTDSSYVSKGIAEWLSGWKARGWKRQDGRKLVLIKNVELWQDLDELIGKHRVVTQWIRGHAGHPENEECDQMAVAAYQRLMNGESFDDHEPLMEPLGPPTVAFSNRILRTGPAPITYLMEQGVANPGIISLAAGLVDQESLPVDEVRQALESILSQPARGKAALQYGTADGDRVLRERIGKHLATLDGANPNLPIYSADRIIVGTGSQQLLYLVGEVLLDAGDVVLFGAPTYFVYMGGLESLGAKLIGVDADEQGVLPEALEATLADLESAGKLDRVKMIYDVCDFNNPTGLSLSTDRRRQLVAIAQKWSKRHRIFILADAAYRELRYRGEDMPSLLTFDPDGETVLYAGTFSKPFSPGLKTGYISAPLTLKEALIRQKGHHDFGSANFGQMLLSEVLENGAYHRHLGGLRKLYLKKMEAMLAALDKQLASLKGRVVWTRPDGGLYVWLQLPESIRTGFGEDFCERCIATGVLYVPGEICYPREYPQIPRSALRLSFGAQSIAKIEEGIARLALVIYEFLDRKPSKKKI